MKMKNFLTLFAAFVLTGVVFTACSDDDDPEDVRVESVTLNDELKDGAKLFVGETLNIAGKVTVAPANATDKTEKYTSSEPSVATVSEAGVVTAVAVGNSSITITVDGKSAAFTLNVVDEDNYVAVTEVVIADDIKDGVQLTEGETLDVSGKYSVLPENASIKTGSYSSEDTDVATVSDAGVVTAVAAGTTKITVTVDGKTASFDVTVIDEGNYVAVTEVKVSQSEITVDLSSTEATDMSALLTVLPEEATNKAVTYTSEDETIATVDANGIITSHLPGTTVITVTSADNDQAQATVTVNVTFSGDYDRTGWEISDHFPDLWNANGSEINTTEFLFEDENTTETTYFGLIRPGKKWTNSEPNIDNTKEGAHIQFTIDTKSLHKVNYFRFRYRSGLQQLRYRQIERIYGSNDGENFEDITDDFTPIPNYDSSTSISDNVQIPTSVYRYYKFWCQSDKDCFWDVAQGASGCIRKIWLGYDPELEE